jgi:manganese transport protein
MNKLLQVTLGIVTAVGGFVDIGELVFALQAGVKYRFHLLWAILVGTIGIILYSEMSGRIAAVTKQPVFEVVKRTFPKRLTILILIASTLLNGLTCAAELGGVAIALRLLFSLAETPAIVITFVVLAAFIWIVPFKYIERIMGLLGLFLCIFIAVAWTTHPSFGELASGLVPTLPNLNLQDIAIYLYFAVGLIASCMMPYEVYFYSSGGLEEKWTPSDLSSNRITSGIGMSLGGVLTIALIISSAQLFGPLGVTPQLHGTAVLLAVFPFGKLGMYFALLGIIFVIGGAAVETSLAGAYNVAQYFGRDWGRYTKPEKTPFFTAAWLAILAMAFVIMMFGVDPIKLVEYAVIFSVLVLPLTYYAVLKMANDRVLMGKHKNGRLINGLAWLFLIVVSIIAVAAIPLMILTNMGQG